MSHLCDSCGAGCVAGLCNCTCHDEPAPQPPEHIAQFFTYAHLPPHLQAVSKPFCDLAQHVMTLPANPERTKALDALMIAKDCAVRALVAK